jgi:hypothetical protein
LTSLNLASNHLRAEDAKIVAEAIKVTNCAIAIVLACRSDLSFNCRYLPISKDNGALVRRCQNGKKYKSNKDDQDNKVKVCKHCGKKKSEHPKKAVSEHPSKHSQHKLMLVVPTRGR